MRSQTARFLSDPNSSLLKVTSDDGPKQDALAGLAGHLRTADLYWATEDMTALAMHSGAQLAAARWSTADRPSPAGMIWWEGGIGNIDSNGVAIPVEACVWGPYRGELMVWCLMSRKRLAHEMERNGAPPVLAGEEVPPLLPIAGDTLPVSDTVSFAGLDATSPTILAALAAAWLLLQQPQLVDRREEHPSSSERRSIRRAGLPDNGVRIVGISVASTCRRTGMQRASRAAATGTGGLCRGTGAIRRTGRKGPCADKPGSRPT
ncbi:hypothetical protein [Streptomyces sp. NPDC047985]|uniref:hypothetical protein n=1 Tax=Streptomyces sp. NPDC047985 TaxID=3155384 RepID=UPI00344AE7CB